MPIGIGLGLSSNLFGSGDGGDAPGLIFDFNFAAGTYTGKPLSSISTTRASVATDLLPTSLSGASFNNFISNQIRITPGIGLLVEETRTNVLLNSIVPVTQTSPSLGLGTYSLWCNGAGSVTPSGVTATITGGATATNGSPNTFVVTVAGTVLFTVSGSLNAFQCELNQGSIGYPTSLIPTTIAAVTRPSEIIVVFAIPNALPYSLFGKGIPNAPNSSANIQTLLCYSDGTGNNRDSTRRMASGLPAILAVNAGVGNINAAIGGATTWGIGVSNKLAFYLQTGTQQASYNAINDTNTYNQAVAGSLSQMNIGSDVSGIFQWNGYIQRVILSQSSLLNA